MGLHKAIEKLALENAVHFNGKANPGAVLGKILGSYPDEKKRIVELKKEIQEQVEEINKLNLVEQTARLKELAPELLEKKKGEKREGLKPLQNVEKGKVVLRMEPSPSGDLHIGHAIPLLINNYYRKEYAGKLILRISDTNPGNIVKEAYDLIPEEANWITDGGCETVIQSDRIEIYYSHLLQLLDTGHAYVCECDPEVFRELINKKAPCPCREKGKNHHIEKWKEMLRDMPEGSAVVRLKTDTKHANPAMRDFGIFRICELEHPRVGNKYRTWPLMNFAVAIDDHNLGLTHVIRGKDHLDNTKRQMYIYTYFDWKPPEFIHVGRVNFEGLRLSASETAKAIEEGTFNGWDDIRLPTLSAMKRRGYQPGAFEKFVIGLGVTQVDKTVSAGEFFKSLNFFNKEIVEPISHRYFFVENPKEITVIGTRPKENTLDLHPDNKKGGRTLNSTDTFLVQASDVDDLKENELYRLMHCLNFFKKGDSFHFDSEDSEKYSKEGSKIMHWLPNEGNVDIELLMDDGSIKSGKGEAGIKNVQIGEIVQLERVAFARLDSFEGTNYKFVYLHR